MNYERSDNLSGQIQFVRVIFLAWNHKEMQGFPSGRRCIPKKTMTSALTNGEFWGRKLWVSFVNIEIFRWKPLHICIFLRNFAAEYKEEKLWKRLENIRWAYKPSLRYEKKTMCMWIKLSIRKKESVWWACPWGLWEGVGKVSSFSFWYEHGKAHESCWLNQWIGR